MTKFKRSYYVDEWTHTCFNSKEVGRDLAVKMLNLLDPTVVNGEAESGSVENENKQAELITLYKTAKKVYTVLPGLLFTGFSSSIDKYIFFYFNFKADITI